MQGNKLLNCLKLNCNKMRIAVFPGSFDPITLGHVDVIRRASPLFDKLYVAIGNNTSKKYLLPFEKRKAIVESVFAGSNVEAIGYNKLTVELCNDLGAGWIVRGLRGNSDFEYERNIAYMNRSLAAGIETIFLLGSPEFIGITSTIVREIHAFSGDISGFVPEAVVKELM
jgi:pantetheine-phosphate adenylyltransferase